MEKMKTFEPIPRETEKVAKSVVDQRVIVEVKAAGQMNPVFEAQLLTYLKLAGKRLDLLINFNVPLIRDGIKRVIL